MGFAGGSRAAPGLTGAVGRRGWLRVLTSMAALLPGRADAVTPPGPLRFWCSC